MHVVLEVDLMYWKVDHDKFGTKDMCDLIKSAHFQAIVNCTWYNYAILLILCGGGPVSKVGLAILSTGVL